jgi:small subunit ribosomal protein S20
VARTPRKWQGARTPSGLKRVRQAERRRAILQPRRSVAKTLVLKAVTVAQAPTEGADIAATLAEAVSALDRAAKAGAIHPNAAARRKSRLTRKVNAAVGGNAVVGGHVAKSTSKAQATKAAKARIAAGKATKAKGAQTAAGKARAARWCVATDRGRQGTCGAVEDDSRRDRSGGRGRDDDHGPEDDQGACKVDRQGSCLEDDGDQGQGVDGKGRPEVDRREDDQGEEGRVVLEPWISTTPRSPTGAFRFAAAAQPAVSPRCGRMHVAGDVP